MSERRRLWASLDVGQLKTLMAVVMDCRYVGIRSTVLDEIYTVQVAKALDVLNAAGEHSKCKASVKLRGLWTQKDEREFRLDVSPGFWALIRWSDVLGEWVAVVNGKTVGKVDKIADIELAKTNAENELLKEIQAFQEMSGALSKAMQEIE